MDFLLECIGFPPEQSLDELVELVQRRGEAAPWRGEAAHHRRLPIGGGVELRIDRDDDGQPWSVLPHYQTNRRLRVAVDQIRAVPDSRFDALLVGWAAPPFVDGDELASKVVGEGWAAVAHAPGAYPIATFLTDARRLPARVPSGRVLAVSIAGFALDVEYLGADDGGDHPDAPERENGAAIEPLGSIGDPGGCCQVSLRILEVARLENPFTGRRFDRVETDAPERPHTLFVSRWQLEQDDLPPPRAGQRIEGSFLFTGRIAGGLPGPRTTARGSFG